MESIYGASFCRVCHGYYSCYNRRRDVIVTSSSSPAAATAEGGKSRYTDYGKLLARQLCRTDPSENGRDNVKRVKT